MLFAYTCGGQLSWEGVTYFPMSFFPFTAAFTTAFTTVGIEPSRSIMMVVIDFDVSIFILAKYYYTKEFLLL